MEKKYSECQENIKNITNRNRISDIYKNLTRVAENNIVRVIKYRRLRWAGHVARMEEDRIAFKILTGKPRGRGLRGGQGVDGRKILE